MMMFLLKLLENLKIEFKKCKKKEKLTAVDEKFREKAVTCPSCNSFRCIKNGFKKMINKNICAKIAKVVLMLLETIFYIEVIYLMINEIY